MSNKIFKKQYGKKSNNKKKGKGVAKAIDEIIEHNKAILRVGLSGKERAELNRIRGFLKWGRTGKSKAPTTILDRFGQFNHFICNLPSDHGKWRFKYEERTVNKFKAPLWNALEKYFGIPDGNRVGLHMYSHPQCKDDREPEFHFHVVQSKFLFKWDDRHFMDEFKALPENDKPLHALYLLHQPILTEPHELASIFDEIWRDVIFMVTGRKVSQDHPLLVKVRTKMGQNRVDRIRMAKYIANPALHVFRDIFVKKDRRDGYVFLSYGKEAGDGENCTYSMPVVKFVRRYLLLPNKNLSIRWQPKGPFRHSKFHPILDAAGRLLVKHRKEMIPLLDLPPARIATKAKVFREYYESQNTDAINRLKKEYHLAPCNGKKTRINK